MATTSPESESRSAKGAKTSFNLGFEWFLAAWSFKDRILIFIKLPIVRHWVKECVEVYKAFNN